MKRLLLLALTAVGAACSDQLATEPSRRSVTTNAAISQQSPDWRSDLVADVVDRIVPAFGETAAAITVRNGLRTLEAGLAAGDETGVRAALPAIENALSRIERDEPGHAADIEAIRLAFATL